ncbi:24131_t:CDS:2, partial [Cetraspora pellucida]
MMLRHLGKYEVISGKYIRELVNEFGEYGSPAVQVGYRGSMGEQFDYQMIVVKEKKHKGIIIKRMFITLLFVAGFLASVIHASIETTTPFNGVIWNASTTVTIRWRESKQKPLLQDLKHVTIYLMAGGPDKSFQVKIIAKNVKGTARRHNFKVPKGLGPSGSFYFLKYTDSQHPSLTDFSGSFTISGTNGTIPGFNPQEATATTIPTPTYLPIVPTQTNSITGDANNANNGSSTNSITSPTPLSNGSSNQRQFSKFEGLSLGVITFVFI